MNEPPRELASVTLDAAVAIVAVVEARAWIDVAAGALAALGAATVASFVARSWLVAAVAACVLFPLIARLSRVMERRRLRAGMARLDGESRARVVAAAWDKASPGQRAALQMLVKKSS
jgi:hypothetical protein